MLAESCLLNANVHPCQSVSMSESRAALWTMDVVGVVGFVARLATGSRGLSRAALTVAPFVSGRRCCASAGKKEIQLLAPKK